MNEYNKTWWLLICRPATPVDILRIIITDGISIEEKEIDAQKGISKYRHAVREFKRPKLTTPVE